MDIGHASIVFYSRTFLIFNNVLQLNRKSNPDRAMILTSSLVSSLSASSGLFSCCWCCTKAWMSTLKLSLVGHSADWVASSHFSNSSANSGNKGCLQQHGEVI